MGFADNYEILTSASIPPRGAKRDRIYIACHPGQRALARAVAEDLLPLLTCEICVPKGPELPADEDELRLFLREMSLVVFVVTGDFLCLENEARDAVLRIAASESARMLMVQMESGIESDFNRICGTYHLLNRAGENYAAELAAFVANHVDIHRLIGFNDERLDIRREVFKHSCFISYRKKDRGQMLRLVEEIRRYPGLLDVALWYDDSLVPGEDYNDQIAEGLSRADCVAFVVTPAFLEEGNYVLEREYPQAVREGKPLIPVIMEPVDESELHERCPQLGTCIAWDAREGLGDVLARATGKQDVMRAPSAAVKAELARDYRDGVRTERNFGLAYRLYAEAAEEGDPWAMARLADDYHTGINVMPDEAKARYWLEKAVAALEELMNKTPAQAPEAVSIGQTLAKLSEELFGVLYRQGDAERCLALAGTFENAAEYLGAGGFFAPRFCAGRAGLLKARAHILQGKNVEAIAELDRAEEMLLALEDTRSIYATANVAELLSARGRLRLHLRMDDWLGQTCQDLAGAIDRCLSINEQQHDSYNMTLQAIEDLLSAAVRCESSARNAKGAQAYAQVAYRGLVRFSEIAGRDGFAAGGYSPIDADYLHAKALYHVAMLGRIFPDEAQLEKCRSTLCSIRDFWPPEDLERIDGLLSLVDRACTVQDVKQRLDFWTTWMPLEYDAPELMRLFAYPGVMPDTDAPRQVGNFVLSAYRCPGCESPLYKTVFPQGNDPLLPTVGGNRSISVARVFACEHGHFFVAPKGRRLVEGPAFVAAYGDGAPPEDTPEWWWRYFDAIGDYRASRNE